MLVDKSNTDRQTVGHEFRAGGFARHTRDGNNPLELVRLTSDGDLQRFYKDGSLVGSIGTKSGIIWMGSDDTGLYFDPNNDAIRAWSPTANDTRGNAIDLGSSGTKFKDLYLSGTVTADNAIFGTTSDAATIVYITSSTTGESELRLGDTDTDAGSIAYTNSDDTMTFRAAAANRMSLNSTGLGIGVSPSEALSVSGNVEIIRTAPHLDLMEDGVTDSNHRFRQNAGNLYIQKLSDDKATATDRIVLDGGTGKVGIGTSPSEMLHILGGGSGPEVRLQNSSGSHYIRAYDDNWNFLANATNTAMTIKNSGQVNFGAGIGIGGTGSANTLDDYEEGTWSPSFQSDLSTTYTTRVGTYTKVGDLVTAWFHIDINVNGATGTQSLIIAGLPFAAASTSENYGSVSGMHCNQWSTSTKPDNALISPSANVAALYKSNGQTGINVPTHNDIGGGNLLGCLIYKAS